MITNEVGDQFVLKPAEWHAVTQGAGMLEDEAEYYWPTSHATHLVGVATIALDNWRQSTAIV